MTAETPTTSPWYNLFTHMHDNHGIVLTDSELSDIADVAAKERSDEVRQLETRCAELEQELATREQGGTWVSIYDHEDAIAELRQDRERLDWVEKQRAGLECSARVNGPFLWRVPFYTWNHETCRAAIDAAMEETNPMFKSTQAEATYQAFADMKQRCYNPNSQQYKNYGQRGIRVCSRWRTSYANFLHDMGHKPKGTSLDRIDVNGNYEPTNCRWADVSTQQGNRRDAE